MVAWNLARAVILVASDSNGVRHHVQFVLRQPGRHQIFVVCVGLHAHIQGHLMLLAVISLLFVLTLALLLLSALQVGRVHDFLGAASRTLNCDLTSAFFLLFTSLLLLLLKYALLLMRQGCFIASTNLFRHETVRYDHGRQNAALGDFLIKEER